MKKMTCISILLLVAIGHQVAGYAKLAENMACVDEDCSEAVSQGKAKLAYQPRDSKFLKLKKGDVVLVKGKKAGLQTDLWGGQVLGSEQFGFFPSAFVKEFMTIHKKPSVLVNIEKFLGQNEEVEELTSLSSEGQKIVIEKKKPATETVVVDSNQPDADDSPATKSEDTTAETQEQTSTESSDDNAEIVNLQSETAEAPTPGILLKRLKHSIVQNGNDPHPSLKESTSSSDETENGEHSLDEKVEDPSMGSMKEEDKIDSSDDVVDASEAESQDATPEAQSEQTSTNDRVDVPESNHSQEISEHDETESSKQEREPEAQQRDVADKVDNAELGAEAGDQQKIAEELQPKHTGEDFTSHSNNQAGSSTADKDSKSHLDEDKENSPASDDKHEEADEVSNTLSPVSQESNVPNKDSEGTLDSTDTESEHPTSIVSSENGGHEYVAVDATSPEQPTEGEHQSFDQKEENTTSPEQPTEGDHQSFDQKEENITSPEQPTEGEHQSFDQKEENITSPEQPTEGEHQSFDQKEENITSPEQPTEGDHQSFDQKGDKLDLENDAQGHDLEAPAQEQDSINEDPSTPGLGIAPEGDIASAITKQFDNMQKELAHATNDIEKHDLGKNAIAAEEQALRDMLEEEGHKEGFQNLKEDLKKLKESQTVNESNKQLNTEDADRNEEHGMDDISKQANAELPGSEHTSETGKDSMLPSSAEPVIAFDDSDSHAIVLDLALLQDEVEGSAGKSVDSVEVADQSSPLNGIDYTKSNLIRDMKDSAKVPFGNTKQEDVDSKVRSADERSVLEEVDDTAIKEDVNAKDIKENSDPSDEDSTIGDVDNAVSSEGDNTAGAGLSMSENSTFGQEGNEATIDEEHGLDTDEQVLPDIGTDIPDSDQPSHPASDSNLNYDGMQYHETSASEVVTPEVESEEVDHFVEATDATGQQMVKSDSDVIGSEILDTPVLNKIHVALTEPDSNDSSEHDAESTSNPGDPSKLNEAEVQGSNDEGKDLSNSSNNDEHHVEENDGKPPQGSRADEMEVENENETDMLIPTDEIEMQDESEDSSLVAADENEAQDIGHQSEAQTEVVETESHEITNEDEASVENKVHSVNDDEEDEVEEEEIEDEGEEEEEEKEEETYGENGEGQEVEHLQSELETELHVLETKDNQDYKDQEGTIEEPAASEDQGMVEKSEKIGVEVQDASSGTQPNGQVVGEHKQELPVESDNLEVRKHLNESEPDSGSVETNTVTQDVQGNPSDFPSLPGDNDLSSPDPKSQEFEINIENAEDFSRENDKLEKYVDKLNELEEVVDKFENDKMNQEVSGGDSHLESGNGDADEKEDLDFDEKKDLNKKISGSSNGSEYDLTKTDTETELLRDTISDSTVQDNFGNDSIYESNEIKLDTELGDGLGTDGKVDERDGTGVDEQDIGEVSSSEDLDSAKQKLYFLEQELKAKMADEVPLAHQAYKDAMDLRSKLTDIVNDLKELKSKSDRGSAKLASEEARDLKQRLSNLEEMLEDWEDKEEDLLGESADREEEIKKRIVKLEEDLAKRERQEDELFQARQEAENLKQRIEKLEKMLGEKQLKPESHFIDLAENLKAEVEERKALDSRALIATQRETNILQKKLMDLENQLNSRKFEDSEKVVVMNEEADELKKRLFFLEEEVIKRKQIEDNLKKLSEEKEEALLGRILSLEIELDVRKKDEAAILSTRKEAAELREKLHHLDNEMRKVIESQDPNLQQKLKLLENEVQSRKAAESDSLKKTQEHTEKLQQKINQLEDALKQKDDKKITDNEAKEVIEIKEQLHDLQQEIKQRSDEGASSAKSYLEREQVLEKRVKMLEKELKIMSDKEMTAELRKEESQRLGDRVRTLEMKLQDTALKNFAKKELLDALKDDSFDKENWNKEGEPFFQLLQSSVKSKQQCKIYESFDKSNPVETKQVSNETLLPDDPVTHGNYEECMVAVDRRIRCGVGKSTKTFCSALECCWQPNDNPAVPNCFFTRSQMTALKEKLLDDSASQAKQSDQDKPDDNQETYERLHEGKVVDWDESVEEKEKLKSSQWDESIGSDDQGNETTPLPHKETEIATQQPLEEAAMQETSSVDTKSDVQASVEPVSGDDLSPFTEEAASTEPGFSETEGTAASDADDRAQDEERSESATDDGVSSEKVSEASVDKSQVEPPAVDEPRVQSQDDETKPEDDTKNDEESAVEVDETSIEDKDVDESTNLTQATEAPAPSHSANEMHEVASKETDDADDVETEPIQSAAVKLLILFGQIPYDLAYVATPLARWWLALLPEDYQNDLFGVPWHIVLSTTIIGFVLLWLAVWRSGISKQKQKQNHLINATSELKAQLETMMSEKLEKEKDLKNTQIELQQKLEHIEAEHEAMTKNQQEMQRLEQNVEQLKEEKDEKQNQLSQLLQQVETAKKEKERTLEEAKAKEKLLNERKVAQSDLETQVNQLKKEQKESLKQKKRVDDSLEEYRTRLKKEEKKNEEGSTASQKWKVKVNEMENLIKDLNDKLSEANKESTTQKQEVDVLKDCLLQFKGVQQSLVEDGDEDELDSEELIAKQKDKLKDLIDVSAIQQRLKLIETQKGRLKFELEAEKKSREETEERVGELEAACENERSVKSKTERDLQLLQAKLNVMQEFYAKREVEMQGKLGKEQTVKEMQQSRLAEQDDKTHDLIEKIEMYKRMNDEAKKEYEEAEKQRKGEISQFEKKAHANWLASREAERKLDEANREINHLRMDVTDYQHRLREMESRDSFLVRPRPVLPHGAPFPPGPRFGPMRHSPLPMRNGPLGPNERSSPPPRSRRGGQSPTGSLHDEVRHPSRPDRPPSIQSHPDRRPPSQGPFAPPDLIGAPPPLPMQFGLQAGDGIPRPPLRGPIPFREGPLPMRNIPPPMRDGPMPPRDGMPPMRDGAPPRMRRPGSAGGPLTSSPYMDRPTIPSSQSPLRPPPPRSSHHASSLHSHGPLPERPPGRPTNPYRS